MLFLYRILINIIFLLSPIIIIYRLLKKKKILKDLKKNFVFFQKIEAMVRSFGFMVRVWANYKV